MEGVAEVSQSRAFPRDPDPQEGEAELARAIVRGDGAAWERFFDAYSPWAYRFAYHHLEGSRADAEDLCSDILMTAARSLRTFDPRRGTLDLWMLGLARRRLARFCHRLRRQAPPVPDPVGEEAEWGLDVPTDDALTRDLVHRALASLPQRQAAALIGKYISGQTVEELARTMETTPKAVESLLSRARVAFRVAFGGLRDSRGGEKDG
jgi:RNA polymerase sigma-70 factor (ECF subfamily)